MTVLIALFFALLLPPNAEAARVARVDASKITCRDATALVQSQGSVIFITGPNTYDRFYSNRGSILAAISTLDNSFCVVGYKMASDPQNNFGYSSPPRNRDNRICHKEGERQILNVRGADDAFYQPLYRTCVRGRWVVDGEKRVEKGGGGISVIGASFTGYAD